MACNSCAKSFSLLRKEKGCPSCGFSYCSKCLNHSIFLSKLSSEAKVCIKCKRSTESNQAKTIVSPPDAYFKRIGVMEKDTVCSKRVTENIKDQEILDRLRKLKEDIKVAPKGSEDEIAGRLQKLKGEMPSTSDAELQERLAKLRGVPASVYQNKVALPAPDLRTEQQQADDLVKQYLEQEKIDGKYRDQFNELVNDIESRLQNLKENTRNQSTVSTDKVAEKETSSEDEEEAVIKIVEKIKSEAVLDEDSFPSTNDDLPFCEICNEDAQMRCLGCRYLFCKRCFLEHKDDEDGCNTYEPYKPPNT